MKFKFLSVLSLFLILGITTQVQAQEDEGGNFFTEESDSTSAEATSTEESASKSTVSPRVKPVENSCSNREEIREEVRLLIRPFKYNLAKTTTISFKRYPQLLRIIIPIYSDQEHRIIFSTKGLPQDVIINVYDKPKGEKRRKTLFTSNPGEPINTFELPAEYKESYMFVEYSIPPTEAEDRSVTRRGCVVMMMGYLFLPKEEGEETVDTNESK
jgi:hypothetical protein